MTLRIALALILLVSPLLAVPFLRALSIEWAMGIWGVAFCGAVVILMSELTAYVRRRGYYLNSDRPTSGIAGRTWGLIIPNLLLPPVIIFMEGLGIVGLVLGSTPAMYGGITIAGLVVMSLYLRTRMRKSRVRAAIEIREDGEDYAALALKELHDSQAAQSIDALEAIAQAIGVSPAKLRISDRFGYEIGTFDTLDDTLDLVGALLLNRRKVTRNSLSLSDVKTVGDFLIAWRHSHVA